MISNLIVRLLNNLPLEIKGAHRAERKQAETSRMDSNRAVTNQARAGLAQAGLARAGLAQTGLARAGSAQTGLAQTGLTQAGLAQTGLAQAGLAQAGLAQTGLTQAGLAQTGLTQAGSAQTGLAQAGLARAGLAQTGSAQMGSAQTGSAQAGSAQAGSAQAGSAQMGSAQAGMTQTGSAQAGSAQAGSAQAGLVQTGLAQTAQPARLLPSNKMSQGNEPPAAVYTPDLFVKFSKQLPTIDPARLSTLLRVMAAANLPFESGEIRAIGSYLFGPALSERVQNLFSSLPPASYQQFPLLPELWRRWGRVLETYQLERIALLGKGNSDGELNQWMRLASESLGEGRIAQSFPQAREAIQDLTLWLTAQSHLLQQTNDAASLFYLFRLPITYRKEEIPCFVEMTGKRKGKGIDAEHFTLFLSITLPVLGEIALRLYMAEQRAHLFLFYNHPEGERLLIAEKERLKQDLASLGYQLGELHWLPHPEDGGPSGFEEKENRSMIDRRI